MPLSFSTRFTVPERNMTGRMQQVPLLQEGERKCTRTLRCRGRGPGQWCDRRSSGEKPRQEDVGLNDAFLGLLVFVRSVARNAKRY